MFEFVKGSAYIVFHCHVDKTFVVVTFEVQATVEASGPVDGALVLGFNWCILLVPIVRSRFH